MSRLTETRQAYVRVVQLLDQEIRKRSGPTKDLEQFRKTLDTAFYLLGWSQFEYLVRKEGDVLINDKARAQTIDRHAWLYLKENLRNVPIRRRLDLIFHANQEIRERLAKDYDLRNGVAHNNEPIPKEARNISAWIEHLDELVERF